MTKTKAITQLNRAFREVDVIKIIGSVCTYKILVHLNLAGHLSAIVANTTGEYTIQVGDSSRVGLARKILETLKDNEEVLKISIGE